MSRFLSKSLTAYTRHNTVQLVRGGSDYFNLLVQLAAQAQQSIHLQIYIFDDDETGKLIVDALIGAAKRGVQVFILVDGYASQVMSGRIIEQMRSAGIHFRMFEPVFRSRYFYFGRRMHYKVFVADARYCLVGGINIANRYNDMPGKPAWLDFAIFAEGEVAVNLFQICVEMWVKSETDVKKLLLRQNLPPVNKSADCLVRVRKNDWVFGQNQVSKSYLEMFRNASNSIIIVSSYFLPGRVFRKNLSNAIRRGVQVRVVVAGISDIKLAKHAERYIYRWIFRKNIQLYEYSKTVLHAKLAVSDGKFVTSGSYNVNNISAYASVELNLDIENTAFANQVTHELERLIQNDCVPVTREDYRIKFNILHYTWQYICYEVIRLVFFLFTFYFKQHRKRF